MRNFPGMLKSNQRLIFLRNFSLLSGGASHEGGENCELLMNSSDQNDFWVLFQVVLNRSRVFFNPTGRGDNFRVKKDTYINQR